MDASPQEIMAGGGQATALESPSPPIAVPALAAYEEIIEAEVVDDSGKVIIEGWDVPPPGIKVVKNPNAPPKFLPAP
jgi:hypothetical protein